MRVRQWLTALTVVLVIASLWAVYPPFDIKDSTGALVKKGKINLGLDLQGGMYLKLEVDAAELPKEVELGEARERAIEILRNRVDALGVSEPLITREGLSWIVVQLPGIKDPERAVKIIGQTALLEFKLVDESRNIADMLDADGNTDAAKVPPEVQILPGREGEPFVLNAQRLLTGSSLVDAKVQMDGYGRPIVAFKLDSEGGKKFGGITGSNINRRLAIILDNRVYSAPVIKSRIGGGSGIIEGNFQLQEAKDLALVLQAGALPAPVKIINKYVVGPTLGRDSIEKGTLSWMVGIIMVVLFMIVYYRTSGMIADIAMVLNFLFLMALLTALQATLTMPGIAAIILTMGMSVDANVLIFERVREELKTGKTVRAAIDAGYAKALWTIIDSNVTTIITAFVLYQFGTGQIKGFGVTLLCGISISMFTALVVTKLMFDARKHYNKLSI
ncbi:protein translocase subunit SecD [candidate division FCPU426 bacterium]|nr:protein translocase subunit SecD [candidate division FCPU426 bacterium]